MPHLSCEEVKVQRKDIIYVGITLRYPQHVKPLTFISNVSSHEEMDLYNWIWRDDHWFPENSTGRPYLWKDLENQPGSSIYYPQVKDLHFSIVIAILMIGIRYLLDRQVRRNEQNKSQTYFYTQIYIINCMVILHA